MTGTVRRGDRLRSVKEFDDLPVGSAVLEVSAHAGSRVWQRYGGIPDPLSGHPQYDWQATDGGFIRVGASPEHVFAGGRVLTVVHLPDEAEAPAPAGTPGPPAIPSPATVMEEAVTVVKAEARWQWEQDQRTPPAVGAQLIARRMEIVARTLQDRADAYRAAQPRPADMTITIPRPHVPHGPAQLTADEADAAYLRKAARNLAEHYKPFGSNLRATVVKLLDDAADAITPREDGER